MNDWSISSFSHSSAWASSSSSLPPPPAHLIHRPSARDPSRPTAEAPPLGADEAVRMLVRMLIEADTFEDVAVSYDGHLSRGVRAFRAVFASPNAANRFREIRAGGTLVGQLYATIGLRHHDPAAYAEAVRALRDHADERVAVQFGCTGLTQHVGELLESRETTAIRRHHRWRVHVAVRPGPVTPLKWSGSVVACEEIGASCLPIF